VKHNEFERDTKPVGRGANLEHPVVIRLKQGDVVVNEKKCYRGDWVTIRVGSGDYFLEVFVVDEPTEKPKAAPTRDGP